MDWKLEDGEKSAKALSRRQNPGGAGVNKPKEDLRRGEKRGCRKWLHQARIEYDAKNTNGDTDDKHRGSLSIPKNV